MELKQLRAFLTVAETGNVTRAAEVLHLVQPAVSRQIRLLEEDIGTPLFDRERHGMVMTEAGQTLLGYARRAMLELDRARAEIGSAGNGIGGLLTLGLLPSTIDALAAPLATALAETYPDINLRIVTGYAGTLQRWLANGEVDAALLYGAERTAEIQTRPLLEEALWLIGAPADALQPTCPTTLQALANHRLILPSAPHGIRTLLEHASAIAGLTLDVGLEADALNVQRRLVLAGRGLTVLPPIAIAEDLRCGRLTGSPIVQPAITRTIVLGLPANRPTARHVRCSVDLLTHTMHTLVTQGDWPEGRWLAD